MKKIIILTERLPYPPTSGTKNLLYNYCKILHFDLEFQVVNISFLEQDDDILLKPEFIEKTYTLPNPSSKAKLYSLICKTIIEKKYPLQVSLFWDSKIKTQIFDILEIEKPDYVIADFVRTTEYLKDYQGFKVADLQDLLSLRYKRQLLVDLTTINPYGSYLYRMPRIIQRLLQIKGLKKLVMSNEIRLLEKFEKDVGEHYDRVMFVAKHEGQLFNQMLGKKKALIVPLGVDFDYFSEHFDIVKDKHSIAFMGSLSVAHNENGITNFVKNIFPLVLKEDPDAKIYIIGGGATNQVKALATSNVIVVGKVNDVRIAVQKCMIFICPLVFGSGIKTKNLEAMAMGMPVVTTDIGAENIGAMNGEDWIEVKDNIDFAYNIVKLLNDSVLCEIMGKNAQDFVRKNFSWETAKNQFKTIFSENL